MNTKKLLFVALMMMCAITVHALQLREGHFFKTFSDVQPTAEAAPALFDYFPRHDLTDEDLKNKDMEKFNAWTQQINADYETNNLPQFEQYITDYMRYAPNQGDTWTAYHLKSLTLSDTDFNIDEDSYDNHHAPIYNLVYLDDGLNGLVYSPLDNAMAMGECKPYPMVYGMGADIMNPCVELTR